MSDNTDDKGSSAQADLASLLAEDASTGHWVLDPAGSRIEFHVKQFWGAITVHGSLGQLTGEGSIGSDQTVTGRLVADAASLDTKNKRRDDHLRSADFFDVEHHPHVVVTVTSAKPAGPATLACEGTLEAAGHVEPIEFTAHVENGSAQAAILRADLTVDRTKFAMTWSPLGMAAKMAHATVVAHFVRS